MCSRPGHVVFSVLPSCVIDHVFKTWSCGVLLSVLPLSVIYHGFKTWSCGVLLSVLPSCVIDHGFKTWSCGVSCTSFVCDRSCVQDLVMSCLVYFLHV